MHYWWFRTTFLIVLKFLQIKQWVPNFWEEAIFKNVWIIWSLLLYFNLKRFLHPNSLSFIRFQWIFHDWRVLFSVFGNFCKLKRGDLVSGGNLFWRKSELFGPLFCISILKVLSTEFIRPSLDFTTFYTIQESSNLYKLKKAHVISGGNQFGRKSELFGPHFYIQILKSLSTDFFCHSLVFNVFLMIQDYFSQSFEISTK